MNWQKRAKVFTIAFEELVKETTKDSQGKNRDSITLASNFQEFRDWYDKPLSPQQAGREVGLSSASLKKNWFFRLERLEVLKKVDMVCTLEVKHKQPLRGKPCPPAYCITCSVSAATNTAGPSFSTAARASPSSNPANATAAPRVARQPFTARDTRSASCKRGPSA